ncbi:MAG TPA: hypothetical protein VFN26_07450 [Candidatus Acidoferrum sp.]|nr:hypothetical protein [Candidatus Acidoferrum sp.]
MNQAKLQRPTWIEVAICSWILFAQVWYYLQFSEQFHSVLSPLLRKVWHY